MQNEKYWKVWLFLAVGILGRSSPMVHRTALVKLLVKNDQSQFTSCVLLYNKDP